MSAVSYLRNLRGGNEAIEALEGWVERDESRVSGIWEQRMWEFYCKITYSQARKIQK
jgi:hypothetical protein